MVNELLIKETCVADRHCFIKTSLENSGMKTRISKAVKRQDESKLQPSECIISNKKPNRGTGRQVLPGTAPARGCLNGLLKKLYVPTHYSSKKYSLAHQTSNIKMCTQQSLLIALFLD